MNDGFSYKAGAYMNEVGAASSRASGYAVAVAMGWLACPFAVATVMHPEDALRLQYKLQGLVVPHSFTAQQLGFG